MPFEFASDVFKLRCNVRWGIGDTDNIQSSLCVFLKSSKNFFALTTLPLSISSNPLSMKERTSSADMRSVSKGNFLMILLFRFLFMNKMLFILMIPFIKIIWLNFTANSIKSKIKGCRNDNYSARHLCMLHCTNVLRGGTTMISYS